MSLSYREAWLPKASTSEMPAAGGGGNTEQQTVNTSPRHRPSRQERDIGPSPSTLTMSRREKIALKGNAWLGTTQDVSYRPQDMLWTRYLYSFCIWTQSYACRQDRVYRPLSLPYDHCLINIHRAPQGSPGLLCNSATDFPMRLSVQPALPCLCSCWM